MQGGPGGPAPDEEDEMARARKLTAPQIKALRVAHANPYGELTGHHDGMVKKALRAKGYLVGIDCHYITADGISALREADELTRQADTLRAKFDAANWWRDGLTKACRRFCGDKHDTFTHDELGNPVQIFHHTSPMQCCYALAEAGKDWNMIAYSYS